MFLIECVWLLFEYGEYWLCSELGKWFMVMELNYNVVKFCVYLMLIIDEVYCCDFDVICFMYVMNVDCFVYDSFEFVMLMNYLDIVCVGKVSFVGCFDMLLFLVDLIDIVVLY